MRLRPLLTFVLGAAALVLISTGPRSPHAYSVVAQEAQRSPEQAGTIIIGTGEGVGIGVGESKGCYGPGRWDAIAVDAAAIKELLKRDPKQPHPLLVNFWATWCEPCREEFPDLVRIDADYRARGLEFITISLDDVTDIKTTVPQFLQEMKSTMPAYLLNPSDPDALIAVIDPTWGGALPATFLFEARGQLAFRQMGRVKTAELRATLEKVLGEK
jgi:thiol-disulfide isomerase/thioredoxin